MYACSIISALEDQEHVLLLVIVIAPHLVKGHLLMSKVHASALHRQLNGSQAGSVALGEGSRER